MASLSLPPATNALRDTLSIQRNISLWSAIYYQTIIQTDKLHPQSVGASHARKAVVQKRRNTLSTRCFLLTSGKYFPLLGLLLGLNPTAFMKTLEEKSYRNVLIKNVISVLIMLKITMCPADLFPSCHLKAKLPVPSKCMWRKLIWLLCPNLLNCILSIISLVLQHSGKITAFERD